MSKKFKKHPTTNPYENIFLDFIEIQLLSIIVISTPNSQLNLAPGECF